MIASLAAAALAFQATPHHSLAVHAARTPPASQPTMVIIPPEFADLVQTPAPTFKPASILLEATGIYCLVSGGASFLPLIKKKIQTPDRGERVRQYLLGDTVPHSSFGWHQVDLRKPLPASVTDLDKHEIGLHNGHKAYLCHIDAAKDHYVECVQGGKRPAIELSAEFTEHFGEKVYIVVKA